MDKLKKNDDCYFYYYSSCMKGESCPFRHEPTALGIETVCNYWKQGVCFKAHCNFRHMEVTKNRNVIPCYWESQPGGCRKPHCPFQHKNTKDGLQTELESSKDLILPVGKALHEHDRSITDLEGSEHENIPANFVSSPPVDPLVVNFEEESDNESVPSTTPVKRGGRSIHIKTLEEIRLERIQAESAAFYQYDDSGLDVVPPTVNSAAPQRETPELELRKRITGRRTYQNDDNGNNQETSGFKVLSLQEIRDRKRRKDDAEKVEEEIEKTPPKILKSNIIKVSPIVNRVVAVEKVLETKKVVRNLNEENNSPRKRAHSPVVFDLKEKKAKRVTFATDPKVCSSRENSPSKPVVVVAARKRPHSEDELEKSPTVEPEVKSASAPTSPVRAARKVWRSSRQARREVVRNDCDSASDTQPSNVFTRKLRLKKNSVQPVVTSTDNNCNPSLLPDTTRNICDNEATATSTCPVIQSKVPPPTLHIVTSSTPQSSIDDDLSLLSPTNDPDISLEMSTGADDILQDIDALLND